jgi:hypothetical protein
MCKEELAERERKNEGCALNAASRFGKFRLRLGLDGWAAPLGYF